MFYVYLHSCRNKFLAVDIVFVQQVHFFLSYQTRFVLNVSPVFSFPLLFPQLLVVYKKKFFEKEKFFDICLFESKI